MCSAIITQCWYRLPVFLSAETTPSKSRTCIFIMGNDTTLDLQPPRWTSRNHALTVLLEFKQVVSVREYSSKHVSNSKCYELLTVGCVSISCIKCCFSRWRQREFSRYYNRPTCLNTSWSYVMKITREYYRFNLIGLFNSFDKAFQCDVGYFNWFEAR